MPMEKLFFCLYSALWSLAIPLVKKHKRLKYGYEARLLDVDFNSPKGEKRPILIYAASGGEALLAQSFIKKFGEYGQIYYCFSWTKEGVDIFNSFAKTDNRFDIRTFYTPFDKPSIILKALKEISPAYCYILETEIWFGLLSALKELKIPYSFVNARMTEKTFNNLKKVSWLLKAFPPKEVRALSQNDLKRFTQLFRLTTDTKNLRVEENLKFESARDLLSLAMQNPIKTNSLELPTILFASIRDEEQEDILYCVEKLREVYPKLPIIICPKHLSSAEFWKKHILENAFLDKDKALSVSEDKLSVDDINHWLESAYDFFVWDVFGQLRQLYGQADIVFVGGSLLPFGGQNFLEPIALGIKPYVGEFLDNFAWVFDKEPHLIDMGLVKQISTREELMQSLLSEIKAFNREEVEIKKEEVQEKLKKWLG